MGFFGFGWMIFLVATPPPNVPSSYLQTKPKPILKPKPITKPKPKPITKQNPKKRHIGSSKSTVAGDAAARLNPALRLRALQNRVSPETETVFDDAFWEGTDVVVNALDNVNARLYVDSRCVYFGVPLLESGTLGTKCNTQAVVPRLTENYGASRDPPEKSVRAFGFFGGF
jgi:hypothetical protein